MVVGMFGLSFNAAANETQHPADKIIGNPSNALMPGVRGSGFTSSRSAMTTSPVPVLMTAVEAKRVERGSFHNTYISPGAYRQFNNKGTFPDKTILVMEHYVAEDKEPKGIVDKGVFNGRRSGVEVAVKNAKRPDGSKTLWAYYVFTDKNDPSKTTPVAKAFPDNACYQCHIEHASTDNVWVQFYPVLRKYIK